MTKAESEYDLRNIEGYRVAYDEEKKEWYYRKT